MAYDNTNSGILSRNDRMREGKKDPEYRGSCDIACPHCRQVIAMWLDAWVNISGPNSKTPGRKFFGLKFKPKDSAGQAGTASRQSTPPQPQQTPPRPASAPEQGFNSPNDPDSQDVPF